MNQLIKNKEIIFIVISVIIIIATGIIFNFSLLNFILFTIAFPLSIIFIINTPFVSKRFQKLLNDYALKNDEEYHRVEKYKKQAKLEGRIQFLFGKNKQHTVWSTSQKQAVSIYNKHIKPLEKKHPKKEFYWIFSHCNNTNNGK